MTGPLLVLSAWAVGGTAVTLILSVFRKAERGAKDERAGEGEGERLPA